MAMTPDLQKIVSDLEAMREMLLTHAAEYGEAAERLPEGSPARLVCEGVQKHLWHVVEMTDAIRAMQLEQD